MLNKDLQGCSSGIFKRLTGVNTVIFRDDNISKHLQALCKGTKLDHPSKLLLKDQLLMLLNIL